MWYNKKISSNGFFFNSILTCNVLKITCNFPMQDFSLNFKVFMLITIRLFFCLKNKTIAVTAQKFYNKRGVTYSNLVKI